MNIPYLRDYCNDPKGRETISHIVYSMKMDILESDALYYESGEKQKCISVILDGNIELSTIMDNGTKVVLENLGRGAILGAYKMLSKTPQHV